MAALSENAGSCSSTTKNIIFTLPPCPGHQIWQGVDLPGGALTHKFT